MTWLLREARPDDLVLLLLGFSPDSVEWPDDDIFGELARTRTLEVVE
ncbi:hypothetical protein OG338_24805 [Streptomyces sp. NBC_00726]